MCVLCVRDCIHSKWCVGTALCRLLLLSLLMLNDLQNTCCACVFVCVSASCPPQGNGKAVCVSGVGERVLR